MPFKKLYFQVREWSQEWGEVEFNNLSRVLVINSLFRPYNFSPFPFSGPGTVSGMGRAGIHQSVTGIDH